MYYGNKSLPIYIKYEAAFNGFTYNQPFGHFGQYWYNWYRKPFICSVKTKNKLFYVQIFLVSTIIVLIGIMFAFICITIDKYRYFEILYIIAIVNLPINLTAAYIITFIISC